MVDGDPKWPKGIDLVSKSRVDTMIQSLKKDLPTSPTPENLSATPGSFIPFLATILSSVEDRFYQTSDEDQKPRLYSLLPVPSLRWKYVLMNAKALCSNVKGLKYSSGFAEEQRIFNSVFDLSCFGYKRYVLFEQRSCHS